MQLPKGSNSKVDIDSKVLLEYYRLEKDFDGEIELEPTEEGFTPITGEAGRKDKQKDPLTLLIDTEMDKVMLQIGNDYANQDKWQSYANNNDFKTFMLLFEKDFPEIAASRYEQNDEFFIKMFKTKKMMSEIMYGIGTMIYKRLRK